MIQCECICICQQIHLGLDYMLTDVESLQCSQMKIRPKLPIMLLTCKTNLDPMVITRLFAEFNLSLIWRLTLHFLVGSTNWQTNRRNEGKISWQKKKLPIVTISSFLTKVSTIFNNHTFIYRDVICFRLFKMCLKGRKSKEMPVVKHQNT